MGIKETIKYFILLAILLYSCKEKNNSNNNQIVQNPIPLINYLVIKTFPHDTTSFTEGLVFYDGKLFESTGSPEELPQTNSLFGIMDTLTGEMLSKATLDKRLFFGEGITVLNKKLYQITYKSNLGFVYDVKTFRKIKEFRFSNKEGWGLTTNGKSLILSDGTSELTYLSPDDFSIQKKVTVFDDNGAVNNLNELESINGFIYANIFLTNKIVKIDPDSGKVVGELDLSSLVLEARNIYPAALEMNGIAYDSISKNIYVTGKMWPTLYKISFPH